MIRSAGQTQPFIVTVVALLLGMTAPGPSAPGAPLTGDPEDGAVRSGPPTGVPAVIHYASGGDGGLDVAIVAAAANNAGDPWFTDPANRLIASGFFATVDIVNATIMTPTLAELQAYDAVMVWSNQSFADAATLGNNLADYVDGGGGVVITVFANSTTTLNRYLTGRWLSLGYELIPSRSGTKTGSASLGIVHEPDHPLMAGVETFFGGTSSFRPQTTAVSDCGRIIAEWSDGKTLAAVREDTVGSRVDLGFYPPSDVVSSAFWSSATDGGRLLSNALKYAAERPPLAPGDSNADGDVDFADFAKLQKCFTGPDAGPIPAGCVTFDFDDDEDVDAFDMSDFLAAFTGPL